MSKDKINDDDIVFRDLDGAIDDADDNELKERAENFEGEYLESDEEIEIVDGEDGDSNEENQDQDDKGDEQDNDDQPTAESKDNVPQINEELLRYKARVEEAERQLQEKNEALKKERAEIRKEKEERLKIEEIAVESMYTKCETDLAMARSELIRAKEEGETEKEFEAQEKYSALLDRKRRLQEHVERVKQAQEEFKNTKVEEEAPTVTTDAKPPAGPNSNELTEGGKKWLQNNASWFFSDKTTMEVKRFIAEADRLLGASGKDPNSPEYFDALNGMLRANFPNISPVGIRDQKKEGAENQPPKKSPSFKPKSPVARVGSSSAPAGESQRKSTQVVITPADKESMRKFGLDPNNKAHLHQWAQEKRSSR